MVDYVGTSADDIFSGSFDDDVIVGLAGNDRLAGGDGSDLIAGDAGADTINGGAGRDLLFSHSRIAGLVLSGIYLSPTWISTDVFADADTLNGGDGDDYIFAGYGDSVDGGTNDGFGDTLHISFMGASSGVLADFRALERGGTVTVGGATIRNIQNVASLEGSAFDDFLASATSEYTNGSSIYGRGGNDTIIGSYYTGFAGTGIWGGDGDDTIDATVSDYSYVAYGEAGNDVIHVRVGTADGGDGNDIIYGNGVGGAGDDIIYGNGDGGAGNDKLYATNPYGTTLVGGDGADELVGADGADTLISGSRSATGDILDDVGVEKDILSGGSGNDMLWAGTGDDVDGGEGDDELNYSFGGATGSVTVAVSDFLHADAHLAFGATIQSVEQLDRLRGSEFDDLIYADATQGIPMTIEGGSGNDVVVSTASITPGLILPEVLKFYGGAGNDRLIGSDKGEYFDGGAGIDTIDYSKSSRSVGVAFAMPVQFGAGGDVLVNVENIIGSAFNDSLRGGTGANVISGEDGDDILFGDGGDDALYGGSGNDWMNGQWGDDTLVGGAGNDTYLVDSSGDKIVEQAGEGVDTVESVVSYILSANVENLTLSGTDAIDGTGNAQDNVIIGADGANHLIGGDGNDTLQGLRGDDLLEGGAGNDILDGGRGADRMVGGAGDDLYIIDDAGDVVMEAAGEGTDTVQTSIDYVLTDNVENVRLFDLINGVIVTGNALDNLMDARAQSMTANIFPRSRFYGMAGDDTLIASNNGDFLAGGAGSDVLTGGSGQDALVSGDYVAGARNWDMGTEKDVMSAGDNVDVVYAGYGDDADGGADSDQLYYSFGGASAGIDIRTSDLLGPGPHIFGGGIVQNFEMLVALRGSEFDDYITTIPHPFSQTIDGGAGDDVIIGNWTETIMIGGAGNDRFVSGGSGRDVFRGGEGIDTVDYSLTSAKVVAMDSVGNGFADQLFEIENIIGSAYNDVLTGNGVANMLKGGGGADILFGEAGADLLYGEAGNDVLHGGADADTLDGGDGFDTLYGDDGADLLYGGDGNDVLDGGLGADRMVGGAGSDIYIVDNVADVVVEAAGEGLDTVRTSVSYTLADNVEVLQVQDAAAGALVEGRGNGADNILSVNGSVAGGVTIRLFGEGGNDQLVGSARGDYLHGGAGADYMVGGLGDDIYIVDNVGDKVIEAAKGGTDHVQASLSYTLGANVEWLTLLGVDNIRGTGNQLDNIIVGNAEEQLQLSGSERLWQ
eukprot:TRINITY_DN281_c0_g1_i2.p1 TRINITY_DN281_c0_g1~~TRINITY_DN281_c0_g1_i2.p1  ORF type:complete len:1237 (+),score=395.78 TRINITY_DN281_c0_g1_i2:1656-5366(+)